MRTPKMMTCLAAAAVGLALGCGQAWGQQAASPASPTPASVAPVFQTAPGRGDPSGAALLVNPDGAASSRLLISNEVDGLAFWTLDGRAGATVPAGRALAMDLRQGVLGRDLGRGVAAVIDEEGFRLRLFEADARAGALAEVTARPIEVGIAAVGLCFYRSARDSNLYAFVLGEGGEVDQWLIFDGGAGRLDARPVRNLHLASEPAQCVADDATGDLYVSETAVGVWRFNADPEAELGPELIDVVKFGRVAEETGGLALYDGGAGARYLIASNASANSFNLYDRDKDHAFAGAFALGAGGGVDATEAAEKLTVASAALGGRFAGGILLALDEETGGPVKTLKAASLAEALAAAGAPPGTPAALRPPQPPKLPVVQATVETEPVLHNGDAADDPAIWVHPTDPARSLIIGTDKKGGFDLYDMSGKRLQHVPVGRVNNVDLRQGFRLGGREVTLVAAGNRTDKTLSLFMLDPDTLRLVDVGDGPQPTGLDDPYGSCMHRDPRSGRTYAYVNDSDGRMRQWELLATASGKVRARQVREFRLGSQPEGCVADDETGALYVGEEAVALWRYEASPKGGDKRRPVLMAKDNPAVKPDLEGVGIYSLGGGRGYIVLSSQGNDTYAVFRRDGDNAYLGSFAVVADAASGIDGASETDGLEVTSRPLGPGFPHGALVVQDGRNVGPPQYQNFKVVPWERIAAALKLESR